MVGTVIAEMLQIFVQNVTIARGHAIVRNYMLQGSDDLIEFGFAIPMGREIALQFIEFLFRADDAVFVTSDGERLGLNVIQIFFDFGKHAGPPFLSAPSFLPVLIPVGGLGHGRETQNQETEDCNRRSTNVSHNWKNLLRAEGARVAPL